MVFGAKLFGCFPFCPFCIETSPSAAAGFMLLVGVNILYVVWEEISEQMEMFLSETARGSFHGVDYRGSRKGVFFSFFFS